MTSDSRSLMQRKFATAKDGHTPRGWRRGVCKVVSVLSGKVIPAICQPGPFCFAAAAAGARRFQWRCPCGTSIILCLPPSLPSSAHSLPPEGEIDMEPTSSQILKTDLCHNAHKKALSAEPCKAVHAITLRPAHMMHRTPK